MSSTGSFGDTSSTAYSSTNLIENEVAALEKVIGKIRSKKPSNIVIIAVVLYQPSQSELYEKYRTNKKSSPPFQFLTLAEGLQATIDKVKLSPARDELKLLVTPEVSVIAFDVPSHFAKLDVLQCASRKDKRSLYIDGSSTYHGIHLDSWQQHRLSRKSSWDEAKGTVAAIMGIAVGTVKFAVSLDAAVGGFYAKYSFGFHLLELGLGGAKISAVATAAGPAIVLGVATAAAVVLHTMGKSF